MKGCIRASILQHHSTEFSAPPEVSKGGRKMGLLLLNEYRLDFPFHQDDRQPETSREKPPGIRQIF